MSSEAPKQHPRAWLALWLLMLVALFAYVDRVIVAVLQEGIRKDMGLSDTQLGTLTGLGFALFYTIFALPIARLADIWVRKYVIVIALAVWSLMTAGSGLAASFTILLLLRVGVAVGEAGGAPTSHSMISDFFSRNRRATALSIWGTMVSVGPMIGFLVGGRLQDAFGWRDTFIIIGLAGLLLVPLILWALPEPTRGASDGGDHSGPAPTLATVLRTIWTLKSFVFLCAGTAFHALSYLAILNWSAPFYQRSHGLSATETGDYMGLLIGVGGVAGTLLGGVLADRLGKRNVRWYMAVPALATLATIPLAFVQFLASDLYVSLAAGLGVLAVTHMYIGPVNATQQSLVSPRMRAMSSATLVFVTNIVGMGLGPLVAGMISDTLRAGGSGTDSLRYAILATLVANVAAAILYSVSAWFLPKDTANARAVAQSSKGESHGF